MLDIHFTTHKTRDDLKVHSYNERVFLPYENNVLAYWFSKGQLILIKKWMQEKITPTESFSCLFLQKTNKQFLAYILTQWVPPPHSVLFVFLHFSCRIQIFNIICHNFYWGTIIDTCSVTRNIVKLCLMFYIYIYFLKWQSANYFVIGRNFYIHWRHWVQGWSKTSKRLLWDH